MQQGRFNFSSSQVRHQLITAKWGGEVPVGMKESGPEKGGNTFLISSQFCHGTVYSGRTEKQFPEISNQYCSLAAPWVKLQNTGPLLKRVSTRGVTRVVRRLASESR